MTVSETRLFVTAPPSLLSPGHPERHAEPGLPGGAAPAGGADAGRLRGPRRR